MRRRVHLIAIIALATLVAGTGVPAQAKPAEPPKEPVAVGYGGAVSTVDATATAVGLDVLRRGGNAVDAAVAAAATLGVTEPFSAGIGGGGFLVYYDAQTGRVHTIDGRESAPASMTETSFVNPATGQPYRFDEARISGLSVGVPGTLLTWQDALDRWGTRPLAEMLKPAARVAQDGFTVDRPSPARSPRTRPRSGSSARPARCTCPAASRRRSAAPSATRTSRRRTG